MRYFKKISMGHFKKGLTIFWNFIDKEFELRFLNFLWFYFSFMLYYLLKDTI